MFPFITLTVEYNNYVINLYATSFPSINNISYEILKKCKLIKLLIKNVKFSINDNNFNILSIIE